MKLGYIGFGEAAFQMSSGLRDEGLASIVAYDPMYDHPTFGPIVKERLEKSGVLFIKSAEELVNQVDTIISAVPASKSFEAFESVEHVLKPGLLYVDVTASTPDNKKRIAERLTGTGVYFVDAAMLGSLPVYRHKVPISASGNGTDLFMERMLPYGMDISKVSDIAGDASAIKLVRSIYMKGIAALMIEMLNVACKYKIEDYVLPSLSENLDSKTFLQTMNRLVTGTSIHAERRAIELEGSLEMLNDAGIDASMTIAAINKHRLVAGYGLKEKFQGKTPKEWAEVIKEIL